MEFKGRQIVDIELEDIDTTDYPDFADAYIGSAVWEDTKEFLDEYELEELNQTDLVYDAVHRHLF